MDADERAAIEGAMAVFIGQPYRFVMVSDENGVALSVECKS